ncbi:MAG TPA: ATP-binding protein [Longimicrobiaceae bacterium]
MQRPREPDRDPAPSAAAGYRVAVLAVVAALLLAVALRPLVERNLVSLFLGAVALAAWHGGVRPALTATALSLLAGGYLLFSARFGLAHGRAADAAALVVVGLVGVFIAWLVGRLEGERAAIRETGARLAGIVGSAMDAIVTTDEERRIVLFNAAAERLFGVTAAEAIGSPLDRFVPHRFHDVHARHMRAFAETGVTTRSMHGTAGALPALRADGTEFPVEATISQVVVRGQRLFTVMLRDVTERLRSEAERERLISELEVSNRAKSEFLATMSHELRTPINAVVGYVDLMEVGIGGPLTARQGEYLERIRGSSQHLRAVIDDVLDMARVEAGRLEVRDEPAPLRDAVRAAVELVAPQAAARHVRLSEDSDCYPVQYRGDPDRVRQVLVNLLGNAVKFTPAGGAISVRCRVSARAPAGAGPAGAWVGVGVEDTGVGIPPDQLERIFEPFTQVDQVHTREQGGTGLGLAISRRLARLMGGELVGESEPGRGSRFTLWLPAVVAEHPWVPTDEPVAWPARPGEVAGLTRLGRLLADRAEEVSRTVGDRLAEDPDTPGARGLDRAQLEDHLATVLVELGRELVSLDEGGGEPALLRDGTDIQRLVAERHGEQRARLGWGADELAREYRVVREEVERLLAGAPPETGADLSAATEILGRVLDRAEAVSRAALARST